MKGTILSYRPEASWPSVRNVVGPPTLEDLKAAIGGGYIEAVPYFSTIEWGGEKYDCVAFCDENGKNRGMPLNSRANVLWNMAIRRAGFAEGSAPDYLVGRVAVVFGDAEFMEAL